MQQSNVISIAEWKRSKLKRAWVWYPNRDENEPLGYRLELVEAIPLEPKACFRECSHSDEIANTGPTAVPITAGQFGND
jgi:hypothetical protein